MSTRLRQRAARLVGTVLYAGHVPKSPGTAGSVVGVALYLVCSGFHWSVLAALLIMVVAGGLWAGGQMARDSGIEDPQTVVIDEVAGQLVALIGAPRSWAWVLGGFVLFRFFDILKPPPVRQAERLPGGLGIMADDLVAGALAAIILQLSRSVVN